MVIPWSSQEDAIIMKHVRDTKKYKKLVDAFAAASVEIAGTLSIERSPSGVAQRYNKAKLNKTHKSQSMEIAIIKKGAMPPTMAMDVAVMALQKLNPQQRLGLVEKMLNNEL